jgi:hypothetical protein
MAKHYSLMDETYNLLYGIFLQLQFKNYTDESTSETGFRIRLNVDDKNNIASWSLAFIGYVLVMSRNTQTHTCFYRKWHMLLVGKSPVSTFSLIINLMHYLH